MKKSIFTPPLFLLLLIMYSCNQEYPEIISTNTPFTSQQPNLRSKLEAIEIAKNIIDSLSNNNSPILSRNTTTANVEIYTGVEPTLTVDSNSIYIVNFTEGGFALVSANPKISMPFGFSETGQFDANNDEGGVGQYILESLSYSGGFTQVPKDSIRIPYQPIPLPGSPANYATVTHGDHECHKMPVDTTYYGNRSHYLLSTQWDQSNPFNFYVYREKNITKNDHRLGFTGIEIV